ncbi:MAG: hypothetical protein MHM6MM_004865 [Cercozoa sp. M6MM]
MLITLLAALCSAAVAFCGDLDRVCEEGARCAWSCRRTTVTLRVWTKSLALVPFSRATSSQRESLTVRLDNDAAAIPAGLFGDWERTARALTLDLRASILPTNMFGRSNWARLTELRLSTQCGLPPGIFAPLSQLQYVSLAMRGNTRSCAENEVPLDFLRPLIDLHEADLRLRVSQSMALKMPQHCRLGGEKECLYLPSTLRSLTLHFRVVQGASSIFQLSETLLHQARELRFFELAIHFDDDASFASPLPALLFQQTSQLRHLRLLCDKCDGSWVAVPRLFAHLHNLVSLEVRVGLISGHVRRHHRSAAFVRLPDGLFDLPQLQNLHLAGLHIGHLSHGLLKKASSLRELSIQHCDLTDFSTLAVFAHKDFFPHHLESLDLSSNELRNIEGLNYLPSLKTVSLAHNRLTQAITWDLLSLFHHNLTGVDLNDNTGLNCVPPYFETGKFQYDRTLPQCFGVRLVHSGLFSRLIDGVSSGRHWCLFGQTHSLTLALSNILGVSNPSEPFGRLMLRWVRAHDTGQRTSSRHVVLSPLTLAVDIAKRGTNYMTVNIQFSSTELDNQLQLHRVLALQQSTEETVVMSNKKRVPLRVRGVLISPQWRRVGLPGDHWHDVDDARFVVHDRCPTGYYQTAREGHIGSCKPLNLSSKSSVDEEAVANDAEWGYVHNSNQEISRILHELKFASNLPPNASMKSDDVLVIDSVQDEDTESEESVDVEPSLKGRTLLRNDQASVLVRGRPGELGYAGRRKWFVLPTYNETKSPEKLLENDAHTDEDHTIYDSYDYPNVPLDTEADMREHNWHSHRLLHDFDRHAASEIQFSSMLPHHPSQWRRDSTDLHDHLHFKHQSRLHEERARRAKAHLHFVPAHSYGTFHEVFDAPSEYSFGDHWTNDDMDDHASSFFDMKFEDDDTEDVVSFTAPEEMNRLVRQRYELDLLEERSQRMLSRIDEIEKRSRKELGSARPVQQLEFTQRRHAVNTATREVVRERVDDFALHLSMRTGDDERVYLLLEDVIEFEHRFSSLSLDNDGSAQEWLDLLRWVNERREYAFLQVKEAHERGYPVARRNGRFKAGKDGIVRIGDDFELLRAPRSHLDWQRHITENAQNSDPESELNVSEDSDDSDIYSTLE